MPDLPIHTSTAKLQPQLAAPLKQGEATQPFKDDQQILSTVTGAAEKWSQANDVMQYTEAKAQHGIALTELQNKAANDPNYKNADVYKKELAKINQSATAGISNQQVAAKAHAEFQYDSQIADIKINANFKEKQLVANKDNVQTNLNMLYQKRTGVSESEQALIDEKITALIHDQLATGTMSEHDMAKVVQGAQISGAMQGIFANPNGTIAALQDENGVYKSLPVQTRIKLINSAQDYKKRQEKQASELQKEATFNNETDIVLGISSNGNLPSASDMANMVRAGTMDADFAESALKAITSPDPIDARTDGEEFSKLTTEIMKANNKEQMREAVKKILKGGGDGKISKPDMQILVQSAIAQGKQKREDITKAVTNLGDWADTSSLPRADVFREFQKNVAQGQELSVASDSAMKTVIKNTIPGAANLSDVPNVVLGKDNEARYVFPRKTIVYPNRIYNPKTGKLEANPEVVAKK